MKILIALPVSLSLFILSIHAFAATEPYQSLSEIKPFNLQTLNEVKATCERLEFTHAKIETELEVLSPKLERQELKTYRAIGLKAQQTGSLTSKFIKEYFTEELTTQAHLVLPLAESIIQSRRDELIAAIPKLVAEAQVRDQELASDKNDSTQARVRLFALQQCGVTLLFSDSKELPAGASVSHLRSVAPIQRTLFPRVKRLEDGTTGTPCVARLERMKLRLERAKPREFAAEVLQTLREETNRNHAAAVRNTETLGRFIANVVSAANDDQPDALHGVTLHTSTDSLQIFSQILKENSGALTLMQSLQMRTQSLTDMDRQIGDLKRDFCR